MAWFRDLRVWQEAILLARDLNAIADALPAKHSPLADQLRRAAASVPTNIAEGSGKRTPREFARYLDIARGSLREVESIIELLAILPLPALPLTAPRRRIPRIARLLAALLATLLPSTPRRPRTPS